LKKIYNNYSRFYHYINQYVPENKNITISYKSKQCEIVVFFIFVLCKLLFITNPYSLLRYCLGVQPTLCLKRMMKYADEL
jgi:hypothetical protein